LPEGAVTNRSEKISMPDGPKKKRMGKRNKWIGFKKTVFIEIKMPLKFKVVN